MWVSLLPEQPVRNVLCRSDPPSSFTQHFSKHIASQMRQCSTSVRGQDSDGSNSPDATNPDSTASSNTNKGGEGEVTTSTVLVHRPSRKTTMVQNLWVFMFRGLPYDTYNRRHVLFYLDSPDVQDFHITAHAQRPTEQEPFEYTENDSEENYAMSIELIHGRAVGRFEVDVAQPRKLLDVIASTPVGGEPDWNCQHFVYQALGKLNDAGLISVEQLNDTNDWMMDSLLDGAIG